MAQSALIEHIDLVSNQIEARRVRLDLAYDGRHFHGWAKQIGQRTVQGEIEAAFQQILRRPVPLTVAGRTDAGVHALGQVAHADLAERELGDPQHLTRRLNSILAMRAASITGDPRGHADTVIHSIQAVSGDFDARFSALARHYEYRIAAKQTHPLNPLERGHTWWVETRPPLDLAAMREFAASLLGEHDFLSFCRPRPGATTIRTLQAFDVNEGKEALCLHVQADAFCHSMVRSLVGAIVKVGAGQKPASWSRELLEHPSREHSLSIAPAHGLTLVKVDYPPQEEWASRAAATRRVREECC